MRDMEKPVFEFSSAPAFISSAVAIGALAFLVAFSLFYGVVSVEDTTVLFIFAVVTLLGPIQLSFRPLRSARFYDDRAEFSGRKLKRTTSYSEIERVVKSKESLNRTGLRIKLRGDDRVLLMANLRNSEIKVDLYSWLIQRTASEAPVTQDLA
ncbi:MAG: hypothetical protein OK456_07415 [Thaumarchaeota archaeon]|nr:hypothetical protein [Nitrososphaerota archaeon]